MTWLLVLAVACLSLSVFACGGGADEAPQVVAPGGHHSTEHGDLPTIVLPARWAWGDGERLETLVASADAVFRGTVVALKGQRPILPPRVGIDAQGAAPRWGDIPISQYEVQVEGVVTGSVTPGTSIIFEQMGGVETRADGTQVRIMLSGDGPIEVGATYVLFASFQEDGSMVAPPFGRLKIEEDAGLAAEARWAHLGALEKLSDMPLGDAEREISAASGE